MTISREKRSQKTFCFLLTIVKRRVTNKPAIGRGKEREKALSLPLTSLWPRFPILPRWLFFFFFIRVIRARFLLGLNFRLQFRGDIFFFFGEQSAESWNKSFSRGWKIYTKSFWPGLRVAPISQIHISTAVRASFSIPYCCVFIKWNFVPLYITCANQVVPIDYGGILGISF